jgi:hypothetical protein
LFLLELTITREKNLQEKTKKQEKKTISKILKVGKEKKKKKYL